MHWAQRATCNYFQVDPFFLALLFAWILCFNETTTTAAATARNLFWQVYFGLFLFVCFSNLHTYDVRHISSNAWIFISFAHMVFGRQQYMNSIHRLMVVIQTGAISNCNNEWSFRTLFVSPMDSLGQPNCECKKKERNGNGNMLAMRKDTYHISHTYISPFFVRLNRFSHISISRQSVQKLLAWWCVILGPFWLRKCLLNI